MKKLYLTIFTVLFTFVLAINAFAASDSMQIDQSYEKNNKHIKRDFDHDFYDPNHVMDDRDNMLNKSNNRVDLNNDGYNVNYDRDYNVNRYYEKTGVGNGTNNVTPRPISNINPADDDVHTNYGWVTFLVLAGLLGLAAYFIFRRRERTD